MHTEDEAKTKWCPMIRADNVTPLWHEKKQEPGFTPQAKATCIGSACMAWRWAPNSVHGSSPIKEAIAPQMPPPNPDGFWVKGAEYSRDFDTVMYHWGLFPNRGYCGLAGRPEEAS